MLIYLFPEHFARIVFVERRSVSIMASSRKVTVPILQNIPGNTPQPGTFFWKLWEYSEAYAIKSLNTSYIQGIKNGTLDPRNYGYSMVNDAYYSFRGADAYGEAAKKATDVKLKNYLLEREKIYKEQKKRFAKKWHIKDASSIAAIEVCLVKRC